MRRPSGSSKPLDTWTPDDGFEPNPPGWSDSDVQPAGPGMNVEWLAPDDPRWTESLDRVPHEMYHLPGYTRIEAARLHGEAGALWARTEEHLLLLPLVLRPVPGTEVRDATSPYGFPGPLLDGPARSRFVSQALTAADPHLRDLGCISAFVRLNPISNDPSDFRSHGTVVEHGPTVWLDLTLPEAELHRQLRSRYRSYVNAESRAGVTVRFDSDWQHLDEFVRLYHDTMHRTGAESWYYFDREYFLDLHRVVGEGLRLCVVEDAQSRIVSAGLFAVGSEIVQYLFSGTDVDAGRPHASKAMMIFVRDWARAEGRKVFHLGGGVGAGADGVRRFKEGFSPLRKTFCSWRLILDRSGYRAALDGWRRSGGVETAESTAYFPEYRRPLDGGTSR